MGRKAKGPVPRWVQGASYRQIKAMYPILRWFRGIGFLFESLDEDANNSEKALALYQSRVSKKVSYLFDLERRSGRITATQDRGTSNRHLTQRINSVNRYHSLSSTVYFLAKGLGNGADLYLEKGGRL
jgi:hypothetical protein